MTENERTLITALKAIAAADTSAPPPTMETALLRRFNRRRNAAWPLAVEVFAAAAVLLIAIFSRPAPRVENAFIAIPYAAPIGEYERTDLVRVNIPVSALAQWGLPVTTPSPDQRVDAEVVLGEDGLARAVRLITNQ